MAWRAWNLAEYNGGHFLCSTAHHHYWQGPVERADVVPTRGNTNGLYAVKALVNAPLTTVWGEVALSGIVVEGEDGYRAEVATIRSLFVGRRQDALEPDGYHAGHTFVEWPDAALCAALEDRYKVEVVVVEPRVSPNVIQVYANQMYAMQNQPAQVVFAPGVQFISSGGTQQFNTPQQLGGYQQLGGGLGGFGATNI